MSGVPGYVYEPKKPLVFISAARHDYVWWNRLESELYRYKDRMEWWDSWYTHGTPPDFEAETAIQRASVAVVIVSQSYLNSEWARSELAQLIEQAEANRLRLFPIILEPSTWEEFTFLKRVQVWNWTRPINDQSDAASDELEKIAKNIFDLAQSTVRTEKTSTPEIHLSHTANSVIEQAWLLAETSNRGRVTSSCLLFGLVEARSDDAEFITQALNRSNRYSIEFQAFLSDGGTGATGVGRPVSIAGVRWPLSPNLSLVLNHAQAIASIVYLTAVDTDQVRPRHLLAALITPKWDMIRSVEQRLKRLGIDIESLRSEFREYIRIVAAFEDPVAWDEVLGIEGSEAKTAPAPGSSPLPNAPYYKPHYSAFTPDRAAFGPRATGPLDDALGVRTYARHLAQLIAAKDTFMPLSIGLFGAWGAGKSHFMDLLDEQLREITREPGRAFHKEIVQIRFNAWHYLDTNLWANLVSEIFDQLFATVERRGDDDARKLENLKSKLADQSALAAEAKAALVLAQNVREDAEEKLRAAMKARAAQENTVSTMLNDLKNLVVDDDLKQQLREVADGLGLPAIETSFNELEARAEEVRSLAGRGRAILLAVFTGPGWWRRATLLLAALLTPLAIAWLAVSGGPRIQGLLTGAAKYIAQFVTAIGFVAAWLAAQAKAGNALVSKLESAYDKVTVIRTRREATDEAAKAQVALAQKQEAEEQARQNLRDAEEKVKNLQTEIAEMAPGRQLIRFLRARATAEDYRRHLGLVSLVRKDFDQLSRLLTEAPRDDDTLPKIDRIVLYIDDLDRCRADRVIEVLEAVHLLLAFPLFAVVVAVDPRWLRQSLLDHYPRLLGAMEKETQRAGALGRPATPQDYLEKIFQVPFNLQPMEKPAFESLVKQLFSMGPGQAAALPSAVETQTGWTSNAELDPRAKAERGVWIQGKLISSVAADTQISHVEPLPGPLEQKIIPFDPERLLLTESEVKDVERFQLLFQTPRAVKRLANTYSLIRVGVAPDEWNDYLGIHRTSPPSYRVPLLLLAVTSAFPSLARAWLLWLRETPPTHWQLDAAEVEALASGNRDTTDGADWEKLQQCLNRLDLEGWIPPDHQLLAEWVPRVARYSF
jgi:hypothetical protein